MKKLQDIYSSLLTDGASIQDSIIKLRQKLHQYPEVGHKEFKTTELLKKELSRLGLTIFDKGLPTGLWAELDTGRKGPTIAIRTDIDALPVLEQTGLKFASRNRGKMHACGHDVHMAVLVGTARLLAKHQDSLNGRIKFLCQPAEEVPPGGARQLIKAGVLRKPDVEAIIALHVDPHLPTGAIGLRDGAGMASVYDFDIVITGKSGHAALPHQTVDAIAVASEVISGLQQLVSRKIDPVLPAVLTFGTIKGGGVRNVIAGEVTIEGTARCLDTELAKNLPRMIRKTAGDIGKAFEAGVEVKSVADYPVLKSDASVNRFIADSYLSLFPKGKAYHIPEVMGGEDFACYLEKVPGAMFRLGVGNKRIGADKPWHHPAFIIDEKAIPVGYITMAGIAANLILGWRKRQKPETSRPKSTTSRKRTR